MASSCHVFLSILSRLLYLIVIHSDDFLKHLHIQFRWEKIVFLREDGLKICSTQRMQELLTEYNIMSFL